MGGLKKPLSLKGFFIQVLKQFIGWQNIPYILSSWHFQFLIYV